MVRMAGLVKIGQPRDLDSFLKMPWVLHLGSHLCLVSEIISKTDKGRDDRKLKGPWGPEGIWRTRHLPFLQPEDHLLRTSLQLQV